MRTSPLSAEAGLGRKKIKNPIQVLPSGRFQFELRDDRVHRFHDVAAQRFGLVPGDGGDRGGQALDGLLGDVGHLLRLIGDDIWFPYKTSHQ